MTVGWDQGYKQSEAQIFSMHLCRAVLYFSLYSKMYLIILLNYFISLFVSFCTLDLYYNILNLLLVCFCSSYHLLLCITYQSRSGYSILCLGIHIFTSLLLIVAFNIHSCPFSQYFFF